MDRVLRSRDVMIGLAAAVGFGAIAAAWGFELIGGFEPCQLCLRQRIPYYVGLPGMATALLLGRIGRRTWAMMILLLVAAAFLAGAGIGVYQAGAEWKLWAGPSGCGGAGIAAGSTEEFLARLQETRVVSCTEASWRFLGLSFAGWNVVASGAVAAAAGWAALARGRVGPNG